MQFDQGDKKAVIYCRVSTKEQVEEGNSLATQQRICKDYALKNSYSVSAIYVEQGESAKTADRTELQKLLRFCADRKQNISAVIVYKLDRLSRNTDDYSQLRILLKKYSVEIKSTSEYFEDNPAGRFMENIIANVAQFDNDVRAERCAGGMKDAVREGRYVWMAPLGYSNVRVNGRATIAPNVLAQDIENIFKRVSENLYPLEDIRKQMSIIHGHTNTKKYISRSYFYRLLRNELYAGWINKFGERHKGNFESIISDELFSKVQTVLNKKKRKLIPRISDNPDFPLRRFIYHSSGKALTGGWSKGRRKKYPYYRIHAADINISKEKMENIFQEWLNHFKLGIENFDQINQYFKNKILSKLTDTHLVKEKLQKQVEVLKNKQQKIFDKNIEGVISDDMCKERLSEINENIALLNHQLLDVSESGINKEIFLSLVRKVLLTPGDLWKQACPEDKVKLQWFYFPHGIEIDKNGSRTPKICSLFKLNQSIMNINSSVVDYRNEKLNIENLQLTLPLEKNLDTTSMDFWLDVREEIKVLTSLKENCTTDKLPFGKEEA